LTELEVDVVTQRCARHPDTRWVLTLCSPIQGHTVIYLVKVIITTILIRKQDPETRTTILIRKQDPETRTTVLIRKQDPETRNK